MLCNIAQISAARRGAFSDGLEPWEAELHPPQPMHVDGAIGQMGVVQSNDSGMAVGFQGERHDRLANSQTFDPSPGEGGQFVGNHGDVGTFYPAALGVRKTKNSTGLRHGCHILREPIRHPFCGGQKRKHGPWSGGDQDFEAYCPAMPNDLCGFGHLRPPEYCSRKACWKRECQMRAIAVRP